MAGFAPSAEHGGDACWLAAEAFLAAIGAQEDDRRLLTSAFRVAPNIPVKHEIADNQYARLAEILYQFDQVGGHRRSPYDLFALSVLPLQA